MGYASNMLKYANVNMLYNLMSRYRYAISLPLAALGTASIWAQIHFLYKAVQLRQGAQEAAGIDESFLRTKIYIPYIGSMSVLSATSSVSRGVGFFFPPALVVSRMLDIGDAIIQTDLKTLEWNKTTVAAELFTETCHYVNVIRFGTLALGLFVGCRNSDITMYDAIIKLGGAYLFSKMTSYLLSTSLSNVGPEFKAFKCNKNVYEVSTARVGELFATLTSVFATAYFCDRALLDTAHAL